MELGPLAELFSTLGLPTALALYMIFRNKQISEERVNDLKAMTEIVAKNALFMERLTEAIERALIGKK